ncbi:HlyD family type I secretion periplasmic adaptor subunit [Sphingomonas ursincola]|jgi:adhesin transport system membrane fusion protein|uniref:HlyD family type I secretion periplasmic adaptor subunit n=1 Tax=Blastomonas TaxID=150203 RepID=UPI00082E12B8|nr:HlyD family type I secretion periplasmic adaptor subunit [Sphingomonas ursincola]MBA4778381.1 HlyD family type I secretion periplasmic adaptor subunit [Blastomonas sp.]MBY0618538.1 HlyD family type I secretion periplasmic adaptor subunit [Sphingomonas ursincola]MCH2239851.1 HlyD family type I secretion periplasmic adaptor subunit [Blastomonas sp.]OHD01822.1 MAG: secretion protein HlyD [Sphingopyxis sp. RIFCSPHIGHO2_01_FULL_65_24]
MDDTKIEQRLDRLRPASASNLLLWAILAFLAVFVLWAAFTEIDRTVRGDGRVVPSSRLQIISNLEGGLIAQILVRGGMEVKAGQALLKLDPTQTRAELGSNSAATAALSAKIARLEAELDGREPVYPAGADAAQVRIERALHDARMAELASLLAGAGARQAQASRAVLESQSMLAARQSAREAAASELEMIRPLVERGIEPRLALVQAQNAARISASEALAQTEALGRARAAASEAAAEANRVRQEWRARAATELAGVQAELAARTPSTPALADRVLRTTVRAPVAGRINRVLVTTIGGSVAPGQPLVELVPLRDQLQIEARIRPQDIGSVHINQRAKVDVTAYDSAIYGSLEGKVASISPDAVIDERTGESFYLVRVVTSAAALTDKSGRKLPIGSGMVASVSLLGDKRSVLSYILTPITRVTDEAFRE